MAYDLRFEPWIPWRRQSGRLEWGPISLLTDNLASDPVVALAAPRPDFNGALTEFLIGMLTVALLSRDEADWLEHWKEPPTPEVLEARLRALPDAFFLDGDGPRFLQDFSAEDLADSKILPIERLLIDAPGGQALELNKDLFVKRAGVARLGSPAAAMALITMQAYAPSGGQGHRTSMRGGGPLTTLIDARITPSSGRSESLWQFLWANVETIQSWTERGRPPSARKPELLFPWMGLTRTSENGGGGPTPPSDGHPLQVYFGMPRRIRLEFAGNSICDMTGRPAEATVTGFRMRNYGVEYSAWHHPLSPYYRSQQQGEWLPVHPQPDGLGWKDWCAVTIDQPDTGNRPAQVVGRFQTQRGRSIGRRTASVMAYGVDFDNMKCRGWVEARLPVFLGASAAEQTLLSGVASRLTRATELAAVALRFAVKNALFAAPDDASGDFSSVSAELWAATETGFYSTLARLAGDGANAEAGHTEQIAFQQLLVAATLEAFDRNCPMDGVTPAGLRRAVAARYGLRGTLHGHGKIGAKLFAELKLSPSTAATTTKTRAARKKGGATA